MDRHSHNGDHIDGRDGELGQLAMAPISRAQRFQCNTGATL